MESTNTQSDKRDIQTFRVDLVVRNTLLATAFGGAAGAILAVFRRQHVHFYATSMALNHLIFGGTFFALREGLLIYDPETPRLKSAIAGSITGGVLTSIDAGLGKGFQGAILWGLAGYAGQFAYDRIEQRRAEIRERILAQRDDSHAKNQGHHSDTVSDRQTSQSYTEGKSALESSTQKNSPLSGIHNDMNMSHVSSTETPEIRQSRVQSERNEARILRNAWLHANKSNLEHYGLSTEPFEQTSRSNYESTSGNDTWLPDWLPFQAFNEQAYESKLKDRLAKINRMLRRDDEYRRVTKAKIELHDAELELEKAEKLSDLEETSR